VYGVYLVSGTAQVELKMDECEPLAMGRRGERRGHGRVDAAYGRPRARYLATSTTAQ
jgi:hypothetical protein